MRKRAGKGGGVRAQEETAMGWEGYKRADLRKGADRNTRKNDRRTDYIVVELLS